MKRDWLDFTAGVLFGLILSAVILAVVIAVSQGG